MCNLPHHSVVSYPRLNYVGGKRQLTHLPIMSEMLAKIHWSSMNEFASDMLTPHDVAVDQYLTS